MKKNWYWFFVAAIVFGADRLSKMWMVATKPSMHIVFPGLYWDLSFNRGVTWSLFHSQNSIVFIMLGVVIALILLMLMRYTYQRWHQGAPIIGELLVLAGGLSNLIDRIYYGAVVDFILVGGQGWYWPAFNIADTAIVLGAVCMFWQGLKE
ncbi:MAG: signal peptidase II [Candidatus Babeliales bacterium]